MGAYAEVVSMGTTQGGKQNEKQVTEEVSGYIQGIFRQKTDKQI